MVNYTRWPLPPQFGESMKLRRLVSLPGLTLCVTAAWSALAAQAPTGRTQVLPDSTVVLRVGDRLTRASDFVDAYYASWPEYRPMPDSAGLVVFLNQIIDKEVL